MEIEKTPEKKTFEQPDVTVDRFSVRDIVRTSLNMPADPLSDEEDEDL